MLRSYRGLLFFARLEDLIFPRPERTSRYAALSLILL